MVQMPNGNGYPATAPRPYTFSGTQPGQTLQVALKMLGEQPNPLNVAFFAQSNVQAIEDELRRVIKQRTGFAIGPQDQDQLLTIMRFVYVRFGLAGEPPAKETRRLNVLVLKEIVPMVASGVAQYLGYLRDSSTLPTPIPRASNQSIKGLKTMDMRAFF